MNAVGLIRYLRHGPLKGLDRIWLLLGKVYQAGRRIMRVRGTTRQYIGKYGPFYLNGEFAFSDFPNWGQGHNNAFQETVEACRGAQCVFDIGAHIGLVSLPMSSVIGQGGIVFAFEPATANLEHLRDHLKKNWVKNVKIIEELVGGEEVSGVRFFERLGSTGMNSIVIKKDFSKYVETIKNQTTVDCFCKKNGLHPEVIKIDVEGAEIGVLSGAAETMKIDRPEIFLSVHPHEISLLGQSTEELAGLINKLGYECREIDGREVNDFRLAEYHLTPKQR